MNTTPTDNLTYQQKYNQTDVWVDTFPDAFEKIKVTPIRSNFYFLILVLRNTNNLKIDGLDYDLSKYDLLILTPFNSNNMEFPEDLSGICIGFNEQFYTVSKVHHQFFFDTLKASNSPVYSSNYFLDSENDFVKQMFVQLLDKYNSEMDALLKWRMIRTLISVTFLYMQKRVPGEAAIHKKFENPKSKKLVSDFIQLLNKHFIKENKIGFYVEQLGISSAELYRKCKEVLHMSPKELIQDKVLSEAKRMLKNEEETVQEIAYNLGFSEDTNFIKFFQKQMKMTPGDYRKHFF
ncbi:helix-turn-helix domain-containing protein [Rhizosphaericola mali]|uniref:Helix-turn-helix transcriptional regulator n=1 Tax=Rhizosphaericola mali TaxID=2545455 RepID=A0A5P2G235_9BACT|nr:AraC family transcriptional regulator [Rhizosphaericola mali]QES87900.1 helix-turn-helix transcriptional regulator [Rhizosphaericola mali]